MEREKSEFADDVCTSSQRARLMRRFERCIAVKWSLHQNAVIAKK
jgi:hypothetical protein